MLGQPGRGVSEPWGPPLLAFWLELVAWQGGHWDNPGRGPRPSGGLRPGGGGEDGGGGRQGPRVCDMGPVGSEEGEGTTGTQHTFEFKREVQWEVGSK